MSQPQRKIEFLDEGETDAKDQFAADVLSGLSAKEKYLPCKYIYDERGSRLFQEIMSLPEYYLTRCEIEILEKYKRTLSRLLRSERFNLIDLGAGDGLKTKILLRQFLKDGLDFHYVPIDISEQALLCMSGELEREFPDLSVRGLVTEYFNGICYLAEYKDYRNFVLFLGSNIGNFTPEESNNFLTHLKDCLNENDLVLIGFDLKKEREVMIRAYNDSRGITAEFNLNLLRRINLELGGNFDLNSFRYYSTYDARLGAITSYLISSKKQRVFITAHNREFSFKKWEPIHTESSYKYSTEDISRLAEGAGFGIIENYYDDQRGFADSLWQV